ncbi:MAG: alpha/beta hydrolase [Methylomonas sp.]|nr:MAG: alpha/beta hydrolase [Methylomonas sp.]
MSLLLRILVFASQNRFRLGLLISIAMVNSGCTPVMLTPGPTVAAARLTEDSFIANDGVALKISQWPAEHPKAIIIGLHGFNDYRRFFNAAASYLQTQQIYCYAYDQRGFGETQTPGLWAGSDAYTQDLTQITQLIQNKHPGVPLYLLGESMGGAVIIDAMSRAQQPQAAGIILSAPAVWGRATMPWYQTSLLWMLSHTLPWLSLTGKGLDIMPSDNIDMLRALGRDPLVIKETRVDAIYGLTNLMDTALRDADKLHTQTLVLYGEKDQIVPREPTQQFVSGLLAQQSDNSTIAYYQNGYHMLLRDLQAPIIWRDIAHWVLNGGAGLPSGADRNLSKLIKNATTETDELQETHTTN